MLPDDIKNDGPLVQNTQIWNRSKSCGDFLVRGSSFKNIRRYGTIFRSKRGFVEDNTIEDCPAAEIELSWVKNAVLRNNRVRHASGKFIPTTLKASHSEDVIHQTEKL